MAYPARSAAISEGLGNVYHARKLMNERIMESMPPVVATARMMRAICRRL